MVKTLLLSGALLVAPMVDEVETTTPTQEVKKETFDWKAWAEQWFTPQQITLISACLTGLGAILGLAIKLKQLARKDQLTQENLKVLIKELLEKSLGEEVKPVLEKVSAELDKNKELNKFLCEVVALSQENNAQSRIAIIELIAKLGVVDNETLEIAKEEILAEEQEEQEKKEQAKEEVKEIIEDTESGIAI